MALTLTLSVQTNGKDQIEITKNLRTKLKFL